MSLINCNECGKEISDTSKTCIHCGSPIDKKNICNECEKEINNKLKICPYCGNKLKKKININIENKNIFSKIDKKYFIVGFVILIITIIILLNYVNQNKLDLKKVYEEIECDSYYCEMASDGSYFSIDTNPSDIDDYSSSFAMDYVEKANIKLGFTEALYNKIGNTRALDGTLTDENKYIKVSWTYHPNKGLEITYYIK